MPPRSPRAGHPRITGESVSSSRLVVDATGATPRLAYEVLTGGTQDDGTPSRLATFVDARTGSVLRTEQQIENVGGSGAEMYVAWGSEGSRFGVSGNTNALGANPTTRGIF